MSKHVTRILALAAIVTGWPLVDASANAPRERSLDACDDNNGVCCPEDFSTCVHDFGVFEDRYFCKTCGRLADCPAT
jgi:hypothetical protein